jgi:aminoglycoside 6'-N-acetyltransferase I
MNGFLKLQESHLFECSKLYVEVFNAEPWNDSWTEESAYKRLKDIYETPNFEGLVYIDDNKITGAVFGNCEQWYEGKHYNLKEMLVFNEQQGKGIGSMIMHRLTSELEQKGVNTVILFTSKGNKTHNFYIKKGFGELESMAMLAKEI